MQCTYPSPSATSQLSGCNCLVQRCVPKENQCWDFHSAWVHSSPKWCSNRVYLPSKDCCSPSLAVAMNLVHQSMMPSQVLLSRLERLSFGILWFLSPPTPFSRVLASNGWLPVYGVWSDLQGKTNTEWRYSAKQLTSESLVSPTMQHKVLKYPFGELLDFYSQSSLLSLILIG